MERFTYKNYACDKYGCVVSPERDYTDDNGEVLAYGKAIDKLAKLENIMENYGFDTIEDLEHTIQQIERLILQSGQIGKLKKEKSKLQTDRDTWEKACELACEKVPFHCPNPPEKYNAQYEYGSDEPYWIEEGGCEFSDDQARCLECQIKFFYMEAEQKLKKIKGE